MADAFDDEWERQYASGRALNRYPYDVVVSLTARYFGGVDDRSVLRVLDLGCGAGNHGLFFARLGFDVTGIDVSESALVVARARFAADGLSGTFRRLGFTEIGELDGPFDLVLDRGALCCADFNVVRFKVMPLIRRAMSPSALLFSWFLSSDNPLRRTGDATASELTVTDVELAPGDAPLRLTQVDRHGIGLLFESFQLLQLYHDRRSELFVAEGEPALGESAEYVVVCRRGPDVAP